MLPWLLCALLGVLVLVLLGKVRTLTRSMEEICDQMEDRLEGDTNNLLTLSTRDPHARRLAARLNAQPACCGSSAASTSTETGS